MNSSQILPELILADLIFLSLLSPYNPPLIWIPADNEVEEGEGRDSTDSGAHLNLNAENIFALKLNKRYLCYKNFTFGNSKFLSTSSTQRNNVLKVLILPTRNGTLKHRGLK